MTADLVTDAEPVDPVVDPVNPVGPEQPTGDHEDDGVDDVSEGDNETPEEYVVDCENNYNWADCGFFSGEDDLPADDEEMSWADYISQDAQI